jgi:hypothetical protein
MKSRGSTGKIGRHESRHYESNQREHGVARTPGMSATLQGHTA